MGRFFGDTHIFESSYIPRAQHLAIFQSPTTTDRRALTWPAAWLDKQALTITAEDYNRLLLKKLRQIEKHGNPAHYRPAPSGAEGAYFPKYLMKALQDHCRHHHEAIYLKLKHVRNQLYDIEALMRQQTSQSTDDVAVVVCCVSVLFPHVAA